MRIVRLARRDDRDAFVELARLSGPGFTSLPDDPARLEARLETSLASVAEAPPTSDKAEYLLMLEETDTGAVLGCAAVKATVGVSSPFFNFKIFTLAQASASASRRFDMDVMMLVNEFPGCTEVGSLFLRAEARGGGAGRLLAQARYLLMAAAPDRFASRVISELRGVVDETGRAPFWDHLGERFFRMSFQDADRLSALTDKQFILDLMPRYPIYVDLLPPEARAALGRTHPDGGGARKLLEWEGFRYDRVIDIFDGGPLMSAPRSDIRTLRESRRAEVEAADAAGEPDDLLVSTDRVEDFRVARARGSLYGAAARVDRAALAALGLSAGDAARVWASG
ncbi:MAG: arginine N-succinyltransferase [Caulobacterales bacterium]|nr:arginine N-succinyltransferase [Caulobacterales bacterium]